MRIKRFAVFLVKHGLLALALLVTAALSAVTTMRVVLTSQEVTVPSLLERRIPDAGSLAARQGLLVRVEGKRHDPKVTADRIVAQDPPPGARLKANRSVRVWLSLGPRRLVVPAVEGESLRTARLMLEQARIPVARVVEVDAPAQEGTVLVQRPPAGETDSVGEGASLLASRGPVGRDYLMPDLIGRKAEDVLETLKLAGLKVAEVRYRTYPGVAPGIILRQTPAAGRRVSPRTTVSLDVSKAAS
ncbi:MAG: PASTA domain-containing protein [Acidobacteria bacterium]|nr:PASTA domain-containing protein [Acidobacteriota bacterium]